MALIAIASDKGAPGVTTAALALAAVWPRPVLLAECDPAGGDLVYRFPAVSGGHLDPRRGVLSLAVVARRGMQPQQVWEHVQKLHGGLDVLAGVTNAEQGAGLSLLWGPIGKALASLPQADVIADCGRLGADGPLYDLLAEATTVVLVTKVHVADVIRLRDRATAFAAAAQSRGRRNFGVGVVVVADHKKFRASLGEVQHVLGQANARATVLGGIAHDTRGADLLSGEWGGNLDRTMLIKTAREVARQLVQGLPPIGPQLAAAQPPMARPAIAQPPMASPSMAPFAAPQPAAARYPDPQLAYPAPGPAHHSPASHIPSHHGPQQVPAPAAARHGPADLAAVPLPAPAVSDEAPRTAFSRIRGRPGRHSAPAGQAPAGQAVTGQAVTGQAPSGQASNGQASSGQPANGYSLNGHAANEYAANGQAVNGQVVNGQVVNGQAQSAGAAAPAGSRAAIQAGAQGQPWVARHAQAPNRPGGGSGSFFSRAPMTPLTTSDGQVSAGPPDPESPESPENAEDSGWGAAPWDRQGPAGSEGSPGSPGSLGSPGIAGAADPPNSPDSVGSPAAPGSMGSRRPGGE
jgi:MinD-like ATPase involved in chromosome partitioning or flagellar assembly